VEPSEILAVQAVVTQILHAIDMRRWDALPALFAPDVTTDYTSLFGGNVQRQPSKELIGGWRRLLSSLDATQHLLGPIVVTGSTSRATAECHVRAFHVWEKSTGGREWMVAGHYVFELLNENGAWRVSHLTLHTLDQTGNRELLTQAAGA
jgi:SnoaL-like domain